jgi:hypothetical protein
METLTLTELRMQACEKCCADYNVTVILPSGLLAQILCSFRF